MSRTLVAKEQAAARIYEEIVARNIVELDETDIQAKKDALHVANHAAWLAVNLFKEAAYSDVELHELATLPNDQLHEYLMSLPFEKMSDNDKELLITLATALVSSEKTMSDPMAS
jgi:hypothetical protein